MLWVILCVGGGGDNGDDNDNKPPFPFAISIPVLLSNPALLSLPARPILIVPSFFPDVSSWCGGVGSALSRGFAPPHERQQPDKG